MTNFVLKTKFFVCLSVIQFFLVATLIKEGLLPFYFALLTLFVLLYFWDWRQLQKSKKMRLTVKMPPTVLLKEKVELQWHLRFEAEDSKWSLPYFVFFPSPIAELKNPKERMKFSPTQKPGYYLSQSSLTGGALGQEKLGKIILYIPSLLGLSAYRYEIEMKETLQVKPLDRPPNAQKMQQILQDQRLLSLASRKALRSRQAELFRSFRAYQTGDSMKLIDPKKSSRMGRLMIREFDQEYRQELILVLDCGRSMMGSVEKSKKFDFYLEAAFELSQLALSMGDRVSFLSFSSQIHRYIRPSRRREHFYFLRNLDRSMKPVEEESRFELLPSVIQKLSPKKSILILLTDATRPAVRDSIAQFMPYLARKHLLLTATFEDETYSFKRELFQRKALSEDRLLNLTYNMWIERELSQFRRHSMKQKAAHLFLHQADWVGAIKNVYPLLRESASL